MTIGSGFAVRKVTKSLSQPHQTIRCNPRKGLAELDLPSGNHRGAEDTVAGIVKRGAFLEVGSPISIPTGALLFLLFWIADWSIAESINRRSVRIRLAWEHLHAHMNPGTAMAASNAIICNDDYDFNESECLSV